MSCAKPAKGRPAYLSTTALPTPTAHPPGPRAQQGPQGLRRQVEDHGRLRFALRSRLRLPRPAHRDQGGRATGPQEAGDARPAVLDACRAYAQKYIDLQTSQFERIGCFGRWDKPYKTMARDYEARTLEAFYGFLEKGFVYRGLKPVYWCIHDRTALAEAEVEYEMHTSPSVYVRYKLTSDPEAIDPPSPAARSTPSSGPRPPGRCPRRMAVAFHPDFEYVAQRAQETSGHDGRSTSSPPNWPPPVAAACRLGATDRARPLQRRRLDRAHLPASLPRPQHSRRPGHLRHRRHRAPARSTPRPPTARRLLHRPALRPRPHLPRRCRWPHIHVDPSRLAHAAPPAFEGKKSGPPTPSSSPCLKSAARCWPSSDLEHSYPHCWRCHKPSSSAPPSSGSSAWKPRSSAPTAPRPPFASSPSKRSTRSSGTRPGARSASPT
jgi:hypothetical protein